MKFVGLLLVSLFFLAGCETPVHVPPPINLDIPTIKPHAEAGDALSQYHLGLAYARIWQFEEANKWYRAAAEQNVAAAQYHLAVNYADGIGVSKDQIEALAWFNVASLQTNFPAINASQTMSAKMSRQEVEQGKHRASIYISRILARRATYTYYPASPSNPNATRSRPSPTPTKGAGIVATSTTGSTKSYNVETPSANQPVFQPVTSAGQPAVRTGNVLAPAAATPPPPSPVKTKATQPASASVAKASQPAGQRTYRSAKPTKGALVSPLPR